MTLTAGEHLKAHLFVGSFSNALHFTEIMLHMLMAFSCYLLRGTC